MEEEQKHETCATPGCENEATMSCPTCLELGIGPSRFCSQECFKGYWKQHKKIHKREKALQEARKLPASFRNFSFTGSLRPTHLTPTRPVSNLSVVHPDYSFAGIPMSEEQSRANNTRIKVYSEEEIEKMRVVCAMGRDVLDEAGRAVGVGVTTDEIDRIVHEACMERGCYPSPLNYRNFPKSVCTSVNEVICHGIPDLRELQDGDIVNLDVSVYFDGFHADLNETFFVGNVDEDGRRVVEASYNSLYEAIQTVRPGVRYRDFGSTISDVASSYRCSVVKSYCGHGVGDLFHTAPTIPHYARNKAKGVVQAGHIFTLEPMINLGNWRDVTWPDNWTSVTADGQRSAQFEHTMLVTEEGCEILTSKTRDGVMEPWNPELFQR